MEIVEEVRPNAAILRPLRRVDSANAKIFEERMMHAVKTGTGSVIVDFAAVDYISSAGLRVIMMAVKAAKAGGRKLLLCGMKPGVREVFTISGLTKILTIVDTCDVALAAS